MRFHEAVVNGRGGMLPQAYAYPAAMRSTRDLIRRRLHLVRKRGQLLAHIQNTARPIQPAQRNYGYAADEILGKNSEVLHTREDVASGAVQTLLHTAYEKGLAEGEFERVRKDGGRFSASVVVTRRNDAAGKGITLHALTNQTAVRLVEEIIRRL